MMKTLRYLTAPRWSFSDTVGWMAFGALMAHGLPLKAFAVLVVWTLISGLITELVKERPE